VTLVSGPTGALSSERVTAPLLQAVPNFSEGRDLAVVQALVDSMREAGADVLDWSADRDHHRAVITVVGAPEVVENAVTAAARIAVERIDLRGHRGVHPRIGSLDVLPFVPLFGMDMDDARRCARRTGERLASEVRVPVYFYAQASDPPGRTLRELRRGGFEAIAAGWPEQRRPDLLPPAWKHPGAHPSAGAVCVGARKPLLAWNVYVGSVSLAGAKAIARALRERSGGLHGVRALALVLPSSGRLQISMNLEDVEATSPMAVFRQLEALLRERGGHVEETEVIGLVPDRLATSAAEDRLRLSPETSNRLLSSRLLGHALRARMAPRDPLHHPTS
jgi:glutamate formiminotransferase